MKRLILSLFLSFFFLGFAFSQEWVNEMMKPNANFYDVQAAFNAEWANKPYEKGKGYKQFKRWEWFMEQRVGPNGEMPNPLALFKATKEMKTMEAAGYTKAANWTSLGPSSIDPQSYNPGHGRINVITEDPNNSNIIYVGTPGGGLWKTTNNAVTWNPLFDEMPTLAISGIVVDPTNSNIVYAATGDGDGGDMFSMGVVKSTDAGATWNLTGLNFAATASRRTHRLIMHPTDNNTLYCAADNGLFKTTDAGATWAQLYGGNVRDVKLKHGDPTTVFASTDVFLRSLNSGASFDTISTGLPMGADVNRMLIGLSPENPDLIYAVCGKDSDASFLGLWRSTDGGTTFTLRSNSPNIFGYSASGSDSAGQSWYDMAITVDPNDANNVFVGGINVWNSTDGGQNWTALSHWTYPSTIGYTHADIHFLHHDGTRLYCGSDGGIYRSTDNGSTWNDLNQGLEITQFYRLGGSEGDPNLIIAGAQDNGSNIKYNTGWAHVFGADGMEAMIDPSNSLTMFCSFQNGGILRSFDGGASFSNTVGGISEGGAWVTPFMFDPTFSPTLYAGFENLWASYDQGDNWVNLTNINFNSTIRSLDVSASNPNVIYFGNSTGYIRKTEDGGNTFTIVDQTIPSNSRTYISIDPLDHNTVYVTLGGFDAGEKVYKTTNGGTSWTNISLNLPNAPVNCVEAVGGNNGAVYVGTDVGVFYYDNTLSGWQPFSDGLPNSIVMELEINNTANKMRAATYGRGIWESPLYTSSTAAPAVSFYWNGESLCAGDSVQFFDSSLGAAPGWLWSFPGGSPSSSTLASPKVLYPATGTYQVSLDMSNANGTGSFTDNVSVTLEPHVIYVNLTLDNYPGETSWAILDASQNIIGSGGPYAGFSTGAIINDSLCIGDGCFTFEINDSYGDGICCSYGQGSYNVSTMQLGNFASGGEFETSESTPFCLVGSTGITKAEPQTRLLTLGEGRYTIKLLKPGQYALDVLDASGRVVETKKPFSGELGLNLSHLAKGTYFLKLANKNGGELLRIVR